MTDETPVAHAPTPTSTLHTPVQPDPDRSPTTSLNTTTDDLPDATESETVPGESAPSDELPEAAAGEPEPDELVAGPTELDPDRDERTPLDEAVADREEVGGSAWSGEVTEVSAVEAELDGSGTDRESAAAEPESGGEGGASGRSAQTEIEVETEEVIDDVTMRRAVEAILMVTDEPLAAVTLARAVGRATNDVAEALTSLAAEYADQGRGFELREVAGGWRYYTREDAAPYVERFVLDGQQARLTQAALETLAVIAYKQPVSRARVSAIRGVNVDGVVRTLVTRGLVEEAGTDTDSQATLYRTTSYFLERMGMQSLEDLPELAPYLPDMDDVEDELTQQAAPPETEPVAEDQPPDE